MKNVHSDIESINITVGVSQSSNSHHMSSVNIHYPSQVIFNHECRFPNTITRFIVCCQVITENTYIILL